MFKNAIKFNDLFYLIVPWPLGTFISTQVFHTFFLPFMVQTKRHAHECHCFDKPSIFHYLLIGILLLLPILVEKISEKNNYIMVAKTSRRIKKILHFGWLICFILLLSVKFLFEAVPKI